VQANALGVHLAALTNELRRELHVGRDATGVVVTGIGTVNPLGKNVEEYWDGLIEGRSTARVIESFPTDRLTTTKPPPAEPCGSARRKPGHRPSTSPSWRTRPRIRRAVPTPG